MRSGLAFIEEGKVTLMKSSLEKQNEKAKDSTTLTSASYDELVREMLVRLGEDPSREGLVDTPARVQLCSSG